MRINLNNHIGNFDSLCQTTDNQELDGGVGFFENENSKGCITRISLNGLFFLSCNLNQCEKRAIDVSFEKPVFKFHFEFNGDAEYMFKECKTVNIKKGRFNFLYVSEEDNRFKRSEETKQNSIELFIEECYLNSFIGCEFSALLSSVKKDLGKVDVNNKGLLINDKVFKIINDIKDCSFKGDTRNVFLEIKIKELIIVCLSFYKENNKNDEASISEEQALQSVKNYIKVNLKKDLNITDLSVLAGMNASKFKICFKKQYGTTVFKYITSRRIKKAVHLIEQKQYTIAQASYEVGYKNPQHFTVAFKKNKGFLPSEVKK